MKYHLAIFIFILVTNLQSQQLDNDTLPCSYIVKSPWAVKATTGVVFHQMSNQNFVDNKFAQRADLDIFYKNYFLSYGAFMYLFNPNREMIFGNYRVGPEAELLSINLIMAIGYNYAFQKNWSAGFRFGFNATRFEIVNAEKINLYYSSKVIAGALLGIQLERYFKLKGFNYIVLSALTDYYTTDYSKASRDLKSSALNYSFTIGYKKYFKKIIDK
jgi:hypothetical protein